MTLLDGNTEYLGLAYREHTLPPLELGRAFTTHRHRHNVSQQELARRIGMTPGVIHHFESLLTLPETVQADITAGRLTLKEARCLADLGWYRGANFRPDERLPEIVALFTSGRLSSVYVEAIVRAAKQNPAASVDEVVRLSFLRVKKQPRKWPETVVERHKPVVATKALQSRLLSLAGEVGAGGMQERCEVERMPVLTAARLLTDRLARVVFKTGGVRAPVGVDSLPTLAEAAVAHAGTGNGVGNRRLALLLEEPRKLLAGQEGLAI